MALAITTWAPCEASSHAVWVMLSYTVAAQIAHRGRSLMSTIAFLPVLLLVRTMTMMIIITFWILCRLHDDNRCIISGWRNRPDRSHRFVSIHQVRRSTYYVFCKTEIRHLLTSQIILLHLPGFLFSFNLLASYVKMSPASGGPVTRVFASGTHWGLRPRPLL